MRPTIIILCVLGAAAQTVYPYTFTDCGVAATMEQQLGKITQMFDGIDDTTRHMAGAILFGQADTDADGKLKVDEFVAFYIAKLASTGDDQCREMCGKLIDAAKQPRV